MQTGNYPLYLGTIQKHVKENSLNNSESQSIILFDLDLHKERVTSFSGNSVEYDELNGQGGFFYNSNTGEVKINLTQPVKHYMWFYSGKLRNEIPANW